MIGEKESAAGCSGYCPRCGREHYLDGLSARPAALVLMNFFDKHGHIHLQRPDSPPDSRTTTAPLFGPDRGKMFGVLLCRNALGKEVVLHGFSGMFNGRWQIPGWVGPLFDVDDFHQCVDPVEQTIKETGYGIDREPKGSAAWIRLRHRRRRLSRQLMRAIFSLYRIPDFRGNIHTLKQAFYGKNGIPTGTGDCCAPKLLAHAAKKKLRPISLAEFYYGRANASATRKHKLFYPACSEKCRPILGTMLCGIEEFHGRG